MIKSLSILHISVEWTLSFETYQKIDLNPHVTPNKISVASRARPESPLWLNSWRPLPPKPHYILLSAPSARQGTQPLFGFPRSPSHPADFPAG